MYGFSKNLIPALLCQKDRGVLEVSAVTKGNDKVIIDGQLSCQTCHTHYQIKDGILDFMPQQPDLDEVMSREIKSRDQNADDYDQRLSVRYQREVVPTIKSLGDINNKDLIDYGCGTGRITIELSKAKNVLAIDFSRQSLVVLTNKLSNQENFGLVLADATKFVTRDNFFDLALSTQVLEHIPTKKKRQQWLQNISQTLKSGARFVCTAYHQDLRRGLTKQPAEGYHQGSNIFFHYFSLAEIKQEFKPIFSLKKVRPIDIILPLQKRLGLNKIFGGRLSVWLQNVPGLNLFGHLVLVIAKKKNGSSR